MTIARTLIASTIVALVATGCSFIPDDESADGGSPNGTTTSISDGSVDAQLADVPALVAEVSPSIVAIRTEAGEGSGVVWDADGIVVTNEHVVAGRSSVDVLFADGTASSARVRATDPFTDLAVLAVERSELPVLKRAEESPGVGTPVVAVGNPLGLENTVSVGIISGERRSIPGAAATSPALVDLLQTDAAISPGNSGGALVDFDARVVGITVAYLPPQASGAVSIGFAIPVTTASDVVEELLAAGRATHAFAGIQLAPIPPSVAHAFDRPERGALVSGVVEDGPADRAGLQRGDLIVAVDDRPIEGPADVLTAIRARQPGDSLTLTIQRQDGEARVSVSLDERPPQTG